MALTELVAHAAARRLDDHGEESAHAARGQGARWGWGVRCGGRAVRGGCGR
ncbi:MAG TPA: hypothetical protein VME44_22080 [Streptosporangiaceae bacterium]|nr:hypothetical protein [Streptosporangiaceae bacterium]